MQLCLNINVYKAWQPLKISFHAELTQVWMILNGTLLKAIELLLVLASQHAYRDLLDFDNWCSAIIISDLKQVTYVEAVLLELYFTYISLSCIVKNAEDLVVSD